MKASDRTEIKRTAVISYCGLYRYELTRTWHEGRKTLVFLMLNPSIGDHERDDPTLWKCMTIADREGYGGIYVANLFAFRSTDPKALELVSDPVGPDNDDCLRNIVRFGASCVVAAWGANKVGSREKDILDMFPRLYCLGRNRDGSPRHPCRLPNDTPIELWAENGKRSVRSSQGES